MVSKDNERISRALDWCKERNIGSKQLNLFDRQYKRERGLKMNKIKDKFLFYETVRKIGAYNMITESPKVIAFISRVYGVIISKKDYIFILKNYSSLKGKYIKSES